jgi:hypothetical protein
MTGAVEALKRTRRTDDATVVGATRGFGGERGAAIGRRSGRKIGTTDTCRRAMAYRPFVLVPAPTAQGLLEGRQRRPSRNRTHF